MNKKYKTYKEQPELFVENAICQVCMPSNWMGAYEAFERGEYNIWLPAKITKVVQTKMKEEPIIYVKLRASHKYKTCSIKNLMITNLNGIRIK